MFTYKSGCSNDSRHTHNVCKRQVEQYVQKAAESKHKKPIFDGRLEREYVGSENALVVV